MQDVSERDGARSSPYDLSFHVRIVQISTAYRPICYTVDKGMPHASQRGADVALTDEENESCTNETLSHHSKPFIPILGMSGIK